MQTFMPAPLLAPSPAARVLLVRVGLKPARSVGSWRRAERAARVGEPCVGERLEGGADAVPRGVEVLRGSVARPKRAWEAGERVRERRGPELGGPSHGDSQQPAQQRARAALQFCELRAAGARPRRGAAAGDAPRQRKQRRRGVHDRGCCVIGGGFMMMIMMVLRFCCMMMRMMIITIILILIG